MELKSLRELNVIEQQNLLAGDDPLKNCDCGDTCTCDCVGSIESAKSTAADNSNSQKSSKKQFMGYAPVL